MGKPLIRKYYNTPTPAIDDFTLRKENNTHLELKRQYLRQPLHPQPSLRILPRTAFRTIIHLAQLFRRGKLPQQPSERQGLWSGTGRSGVGTARAGEEVIWKVELNIEDRVNGAGFRMTCGTRDGRQEGSGECLMGDTVAR